MKAFLNFILSLFSKNKKEENDTNVSNFVTKTEEKPKEKTVEEKKIEPVDWALKITVKRKIFNECDTIGDLYVSYPDTPGTLEFVCNTLEDKVRNKKDTKKEDFKKVYGETAIPYGTYRVIISYSNAFKKNLPEVLEVPLYEGIRIHTGNTKKDTYGCLLLGDSPKISQTESWIYNSKKNFDKFMKILEPALKKGKVIIEYTD
jgi:hypothetical protein